MTAKKPKNPRVNGRYHKEIDKVDLVKTYIILQDNLALAARTCGIPLGTAKYWKSLAWWEETEQKLRAEDKIVVSKRMTKMLDLASEVVIDRLEKGDFFYDPRTGKLERKPVGLKDAHTVFKDVIDLKAAQDRKPQEEKEQQTIRDTLLSLAKNFEELAAKQKAKPVVQVTDVLFVEEKPVEKEEDDAIHEERP